MKGLGVLGATKGVCDTVVGGFRALPPRFRLAAWGPAARCSPPMPGHGRTTEVHLRQVEIVGFAGECDPVRGVLTTHGHGVAVMVFETVAGRAPSALFVDEATTAPVPLVHGPADGGRDVARGGLRLGLREVLAGGLRETEAAGLEPFELLGDGVFDDGGEVGAGDGGAQEGLEPLELVAQPGAGGELDAVAPGGERLDARRGSRRGCDTDLADSVWTEFGARTTSLRPDPGPARTGQRCGPPRTAGQLRLDGVRRRSRRSGRREVARSSGRERWAGARAASG